MAHLEHYTKKERWAVVREASRDASLYKNYVDHERTDLNYAMVNTLSSIFGTPIVRDYKFYAGSELRDEVERGLRARVEQYQKETGCQVRKNSVVLSSWVVQCPEVLRGDVDNEKKFFEEVNGFMMKELGRKNVIATFVHYDETTPHCHVHTVPCGHNRKTGKPAIGSNAVYTREYLKDFHVRFNDHMEAAFGIKNLIVTEERVTSQRGNLSLVEFKKAKLTEEVEKLTEEVEDLEIRKKKGVTDVLALQDTQRDLKESTNALRARMDELEARNRELVIRNVELQNSVKNLEESEKNYKRIVKEAHEQYKEVTRKITDLWQRLFRYEKQANDVSKKRAYRNLRSEIEKDEDMDLEL